MSRLSLLLLAGPGALLLLALIIIPALLVVPISLTDWEFGKPALSFVGLANFVEIADDERALAAFGNTLIYALFVVPLTLALALAVALAVEGAARGRSFYRTIYFLPTVATMAAMAVAWEAMLHPTVGFLNQFIGWFDVAPRNWLMDETFVLPTLIVIGIWQNLGFAVVMFLAGLQTIPRDLKEAAALDGVNGLFDRARVVTLPLLGPVTLFVTIITAKRALGVFDSVAVLTDGGPGVASEVMLHLIYVESFEQLRAGYGAALMLLYILLLMIVIIGQRVADRRIHYT